MSSAGLKIWKFKVFVNNILLKDEKRGKEILEGRIIGLIGISHCYCAV